MKKSLINTTGLILALLICLVQPKAQQSTIDYDLSNYQLPNLKRHVLEFNFDVSGSSYSTITENEGYDPQKRYQKYFSSVLSPNYSYYLNTEKYQLTHSLSAEIPKLYFNSNEDISYNTRSFNLQPHISYDGELREYLKGKFFLEQNFQIGLGTYNHNSFNENKDDPSVVVYDITQNSNSQNVNISIPILIGWGRIERVEDARLAVYILDDLNKAGQLAREVSNEDIEKLAGRISEVQNERFFDSRLAKIWELKQIDSLLIDMGLIESGNITYYTLLNDNWDYASGPARQSGFRISAGISPEYYYENFEGKSEENYYNPDTSYTDQTQQKYRNSGGSLLLRVNYEKPLNLNWQLSASNELATLKLFSKDFESNVYSDTTQKYNRIAINDRIYASLSYYPNSRTTMSVFISEYFSYWKKMPVGGENTKEISLTSRLGINIDYYISPRIRLDVYTSIYHLFIRDRELTESSTKEFECHFGASLVYKLL